MNKTNIAWADYTWNPITGCTAVSDGCKNCYAKAVHERFYDTDFSEIVFHKNRLNGPNKVKKPSKIFIGSMTDVFQDSISCKLIDKILKIVSENPHHTFIFLTKRAKRMKEYFAARGEYLEFLGIANLWLGVTAETQKEADIRIPILLDIPAAKRFVSIEPMIDKIDLKNLINDYAGIRTQINSLSGWKAVGNADFLNASDCQKLDWVIVGGESGAKSKVRQMDSEWVRKLYLQCVESKTAFFFKQWGAHKPKYNSKFELVQEFPK